MDKALERKIAQAKIFAETGTRQKDIAARFSVSERTVRRWLSLSLPPEVQSEIDQVSREHRAKFITDAWRVIHKLNVLVEQRVDEGDFRGKDAAVALAVLIDKVRTVEPRLPEVKEVRTLKFNFTSGVLHVGEGRPDLPGGSLVEEVRDDQPRPELPALEELLPPID